MLKHVGLSPEQQTAASTTLSGNGIHPNNGLVAFSCSSATCIKEAFEKPARVYVDYRLLDAYVASNELATTIANSGTQFIVTTQTAFELPVANEIARKIIQQYGVSDDTGYQLETAMHEAIANAIIHGNLGIGISYENIKEFNAFFDAVEQSLKSNTQSQKKLMITYKKNNNIVSVMITDEGEGFDFTPIQDEYKTHLLSGNGRFLMKHYSETIQYHNGGSCVELRFEV